MEKSLSLKSDAFAAFEKLHAENHEVENLEIAPFKHKQNIFGVLQSQFTRSTVVLQRVVNYSSTRLDKKYSTRNYSSIIFENRVILELDSTRLVNTREYSKVLDTMKNPDFWSKYS